jgi:Na+-transporting methylmalonyl-CoA/oxaloacetate decarboxylase beta subunit
MNCDLLMICLTILIGITIISVFATVCFCNAIKESKVIKDLNKTIREVYKLPQEEREKRTEKKI